MRFIVSVRFLQAENAFNAYTQLGQKKRNKYVLASEWVSHGEKPRECKREWECCLIRKMSYDQEITLCACMRDASVSLFISVNDLVNYYPCCAIPLSHLRFSGYFHVHQMRQKKQCKSTQSTSLTIRTKIYKYRSVCLTNITVYHRSSNNRDISLSSAS